MLAIRAKAELELRKRRQQDQSGLASPRESRWYEDRAYYVNSERGFVFEPATPDAARFVYEDGPWSYGLIRGGEGSGKSTHAIIKVLERLRRGMSGASLSPDLPHFKKSLWPEFKRWCPWHAVAPKHQRYRSDDWTPPAAFEMVFRHNGRTATLWLGGIENPESWEGPNLSFIHLDEARRAKTNAALKVAVGRTRIDGPKGELPQVFISTTPRKHWLYDMFGPLQDNDPFASFKRISFDVQMSTVLNQHRLASTFLTDRATMFSDAEKEALIHGGWADLDDQDRFMSSMTTWDICRADLPPLGRNEACVAAIDAGVVSDNFAFIIVSRSHTDPESHVWVRVVRVWEPKNGRELDFAAIEREIIELCHHYAIYEVAYDGYQMVQMAQNLRRQDINVREFSQGADRRTADKNLGDIIIQRKLQHDGDPMLRRHIDNADRKVDANDSGYRLVKRADSLKIDAAVALSMAVYRCFKLNLA